MKQTLDLFFWALLTFPPSYPGSGSGLSSSSAPVPALNLGGVYTDSREVKFHHPSFFPQNPLPMLFERQ